MSSGSQCDVQEPENVKSSSSNHDKMMRMSAGNLNGLNQTTEANDNYKIWDGDDGNDEVLHQLNSSSEPILGKQNCGRPIKCFVDETKSLAKPSLEGSQEIGHLEIAADR
ncbi:hypothetical protein PPACK8108_LOCUS1592 [Phakopsora pachyrhizi]|uniref:Uncharacterized protein n=1 Tax=Phakopsora pachyrhizi TaxID=170000 RepID=A0AAV0AI18_PHAPC|nr:hypothetical protein PPACK8108_LOCUS1592 [Phakopsora pachyrhizi]